MPCSSSWNAQVDVQSNVKGTKKIFAVPLKKLSKRHVCHVYASICMALNTGKLVFAVSWNLIFLISCLSTAKLYFGLKISLFKNIFLLPAIHQGSARIKDKKNIGNEKNIKIQLRHLNFGRGTERKQEYFSSIFCKHTDDVDELKWFWGSDIWWVKFSNNRNGTGNRLRI